MAGNAARYCVFRRSLGPDEDSDIDPAYGAAALRTCGEPLHRDLL
jgi:hypothetical protein